jgi:hypothetical protein
MRIEPLAMNDRLNPKIDRRDVLRVLTAGAGAAVAGAAQLAPAAADTPKITGRRVARYQANSPEVQNFYRVNRYPTK